MEITAFFFLMETKGIGSCEVCGQWGMIKVFCDWEDVFILTRDGKMWGSTAESRTDGAAQTRHRGRGSSEDLDFGPELTVGDILVLEIVLLQMNLYTKQK